MSLDPDQWRPASGCSRGYQKPSAGERVGWRYAVWLVDEVRVWEWHDLSADERAKVMLYKADYRDRYMPYTVVLTHERGPVLTETITLHDGRKTVHLGVPAGAFDPLPVLPERYETCSCHGYPWPCQDVDRDRATEREAKRLDRLLATTTPGVCAHCLEPVTARQKSLTFPEPSLLVPGAPGPTFHAGRGACYHVAGEYETRHRLKAYPTAARLASCAGTAYRHILGGAVDCSAGSACSGHHYAGSGYDCFTATWVNGGWNPRPTTDCGYRDGGLACLGAGATTPTPIDRVVRDLGLE